VRDLGRLWETHQRPRARSDTGADLPHLCGQLNKAALRTKRYAKVPEALHKQFGSIKCHLTPDEGPVASFAMRAEQQAQTAHPHRGYSQARHTAVGHAELERPISSAYGIRTLLGKAG
jgi:hypothetical protein